LLSSKHTDHREFIGFADELAIVMPLNWVTQVAIPPILVPVFGQIDTLSLQALRQSKSYGRRNVGKAIYLQIFSQTIFFANCRNFQ